MHGVADASPPPRVAAVVHRLFSGPSAMPNAQSPVSRSPALDTLPRPARGTNQRSPGTPPAKAQSTGAHGQLDELLRQLLAVAGPEAAPVWGLEGALPDDQDLHLAPTAHPRGKTPIAAGEPAQLERLLRSALQPVGPPQRGPPGSSGCSVASGAGSGGFRPQLPVPDEARPRWPDGSSSVASPLAGSVFSAAVSDAVHDGGMAVPLLHEMPRLGVWRGRSPRQDELQSRSRALHEALARLESTPL